MASDTKDKTDTIYSNKLNQIEQFSFDENVAQVFPDMLKRSVPGYALIQEMIGVLSKHYSVDNSNLYDLGCSLGASCVSMLANQNSDTTQLIAIDNSAAMIKAAEENLKQFCEENKINNTYKLLCEDIQSINYQNASIINLNFTLQFIDPADREGLLNKLYQALLPGGILILSEKVNFESEKDALLSDLHHDFKRSQGYSDLEISQKRSALENVLIRDSEEEHHSRLKAAGFEQSHTWFQCFNFLSILAIKA
jgi:tRNA (cmo5U34)-methyltransferase